MPNIVFLDRDGLAAHIKLPPITTADGVVVDVVSHPNTKAADTATRLKDADIAISNKVVIDRAVLAACPRLKHIAVAATGYNIADIPACVASGVSVSHIPSYANHSVPEHAIMLMLNLRRQFLAYRQHIVDGEWSKSPAFCLYKEPFKDLRESVLGIIGFGELGQATAALGHALGMRVVFYARQKKSSDFAQQLPLDELLQQADIVSLHCALNENSANLIGSKELALMQKHAILINTARGGIVDEAAAALAIKSGQIGGLGFDVLVQEPPAPDHPLLQLADQPNVIITPHIAWASDTAMQRLANSLVANIESFLRGKPLNLVS